MKIETLIDHTGMADPINKAQHSPLPWRVAPDGMLIHVGDANDPEIVCSTYINDEMAVDISYGEANAKLIVRAVNHADKLAEALRVALAEIKAIANDCLTEGKAMKWLYNSEQYHFSKSALADYDWSTQNE